MELWIELVEEKEHREKKLTWKNLWHCETSTPVHYVQFSSDGSYFASLGKVMIEFTILVSDRLSSGIAGRRELSGTIPDSDTNLKGN